MNWLSKVQPTAAIPDMALEVLLLELLQFGSVTVNSWDDGTWWATIEIGTKVEGAQLKCKSESRVHRTPTAAVAQLLERVRQATGIKG